MVLLEPLGVERVAARIPPDHRCLAGVTMDEGLSETRLAVGCGLETATELIHRADTIVIKAAGGEPSTLLLPAAATVQWVSGPLDEPATGDGCAGVPDRKKPVFVSTTIRTDEAQDPIRSRSMYLLVPEFKATLRIGYTWRDYCHGTHDPHQQTYRVTCNSGENRSSVEAMIVGDALLFAARSGGYGDHHYSPLGGFRIPCGAKVSFPVVHRVDPEYSPPGPCVSACGTSTDLCRDRCLARYADRETEGSPGLLCLDRCRAQDNACSSRCR